MIQLSEASNGRVLIAGQPYQKGLLRVRYSNAGTISIQDPFNMIMTDMPFTQFVNPATGNPFESLTALKAFVDANFFRTPGQSGSGFPYSFPFAFS